jgi:hypothetical protein
MNPRERLLSLITGSLVALLGCYWAFSTVWGWFEARDTRLVAAQRDLKKKNDELLKVQIAAKKLAEYEQQSLPRDVDLSQTLYQSWLLSIAQEAGLSEIEIKTTKPKANQRTYYSLGYTLHAQGSWSQWVAWFHAFQSQAVLHRVDAFSVQTLKNSRQLDGALAITAVCVNSAPPATEWKSHARENFPELASFSTPIMNRNFFFPPNQPPRLENGSTQTGYVGKSWEWSAKAKDPDAFDRVTFQLVQTNIPDLRFDDKSGRASWSSPQKGDYQLELALLDDGFPPQRTQQTVKVSISDPPPPPVEPPKKLAFDVAKYTYFTAVLEVNGESEVWLHIRPTGELKKLHVGDAFSIGSMAAKVVEIQPESLLFEEAGGLRRLIKGGILFEAQKTTSQAPPTPDEN